MAPQIYHKKPKPQLNARLAADQLPQAAIAKARGADLNVIALVDAQNAGANSESQFSSDSHART